jgi:hypothetical protein
MCRSTRGAQSEESEPPAKKSSLEDGERGREVSRQHFVFIKKALPLSRNL